MERNGTVYDTFIVHFNFVISEWFFMFSGLNVWNFPKNFIFNGRMLRELDR